MQQGLELRPGAGDNKRSLLYADNPIRSLRCLVPRWVTRIWSWKAESLSGFLTTDCLFLKDQNCLSIIHECSGTLSPRQQEGSYFELRALWHAYWSTRLVVVWEWLGSGKNWHVAAKMRSRLLQDAFISTPFALNHLMIGWLFLHKTMWWRGINRHKCGEKKMEKKRKENGKWIMLVVPNWLCHGCYHENKVFFSPLHRDVMVNPKEHPPQELAQSMFSTRFLQQAICAWPLTPPPAENHSHNLWIMDLPKPNARGLCLGVKLAVWLHTLHTQHINDTVLSPIFLCLFTQARQLFRLLCQTGWINMQEQNIDVPLVFIYNKTQTPQRWHKVQNKTHKPSRISSATVIAASGWCWTIWRTKWLLKVNLLLDF